MGISRSAVSGSACVGAGLALNSASSPRPNRLGNFSGGIIHFSCGITFHQFSGNTHVRLGSDRSNVVQNDRLAKTWGFSEADIPRNHACEDLRAEILASVVGNLPREVESRVVHGKEHAGNRQIRVYSLLNAVDRV